MPALSASEWGDHSRSERLKPPDNATVIIIIILPALLVPDASLQPPRSRSGPVEMSSIDLPPRSRKIITLHTCSHHDGSAAGVPIDPNTNADVLQSAGEAFAMDGAAVLPCAVGTLGLG